MGQKNSSEIKKNSSQNTVQSSPVAPPSSSSLSQSVSTNGSHLIKPSNGGMRKNKKNMRGGMATVHWDKMVMNQPSNSIMEWATTAPKSLLGGRRRTHKRRGHKKSRKVKRHHQRSKRHHKKRH